MSDLHVSVDDAQGFWHRSGDTVVRGHAFHGGELLRPPDLADLVDGTPFTELPRLVPELNGFYSVVRRAGDRAYLAVDHVRSYPLFLGTTDDGAFVSNDAHSIKERLADPRVDPLLEYEFLLTGYVTGRDTLYPDIAQLEAGSSAVVDASGGDVSVTTSRYSRFEHRPPTDATEAELLDELDTVLAGAFERLVEVADGRQLAISLSGGPDSRLIACMLRRLDYPNLVAFTYGRAGNWDSRVATEVARALDIPLAVVRYDHDTWWEWFRSDERRDYYRYAFNFSDLPNIGTVPAMGRLDRTDAIEDDAIVLCGNLTPSENDYPLALRRAAPSTEAELAEFVVDRMYKYWRWDDERAEAAFRSRIESQLDFAGGTGEEVAIAAYKDWRIRNINAKLMVAPEEYAFRGYDSWTPLWDETYMDFWQRVPIGYRHGKRLHRTHVRELYRDLTGEEVTDDRKPTSPIRRIEQAIARSPLHRAVRPAYERVEDAYSKLTRESPYTRDPVATLGIMSETQFEELCYAYHQNVHPFKALEVLGCVSFDPPRNYAGPVDGVLEMDRLRTEAHRTRRESLPWFR